MEQMNLLKCSLMTLCICAICSTAPAEPPSGLAAEWNFDEVAGDPCQGTITGETSIVEERDGTLLVPLKLTGQMQIVIYPAAKASTNGEQQP
jgi:hypothetical protein